MLLYMIGEEVLAGHVSPPGAHEMLIAPGLEQKPYQGRLDQWKRSMRPSSDLRLHT